jgi:hypothetical protein
MSSSVRYLPFAISRNEAIFHETFKSAVNQKARDHHLTRNAFSLVSSQRECKREERDRILVCSSRKRVAVNFCFADTSINPVTLFLLLCHLCHKTVVISNRIYRIAETLRCDEERKFRWKLSRLRQDSTLAICLTKMILISLGETNKRFSRDRVPDDIRRAASSRARKIISS